MRNVKSLFLVMLAALAVLMLLRALQSRKGVDVAEEVEELGLEPLLPEGFAIKQVKGITIVGPEDAAEPLVLARDARGQWTVSSAHSAPADRMQGRRVTSFSSRSPAPLPVTKDRFVITR